MFGITGGTGIEGFIFVFLIFIFSMMSAILVHGTIEDKIKLFGKLFALSFLWIFSCYFTATFIFNLLFLPSILAIEYRYYYTDIIFMISFLSFYPVLTQFEKKTKNCLD